MRYNIFLPSRKPMIRLLAGLTADFPGTFRVQSPRIIPCEGIRRASARQAFSLVEVVMAIGIVSFGLIMIFGLLPTGLNSVKDGKLQEVATDVLAAAANDLHNTSRASVSALSPIYGIQPYAVSPQPAVIDVNSVGGLVPAAEAAQASLRLRATPRPSTNPSLAIWHLALEPLPQSTNPPILAETVVVLQR